MARQKETIKNIKQKENKYSAPKNKKATAAQSKAKNTPRDKKNTMVKNRTKIARTQFEIKDNEFGIENKRVLKQETILVPIELLGIRVPEPVEEPEKKKKKREKKAKREKTRRPDAQETFLDSDKQTEEKVRKPRNGKRALRTIVACLVLAGLMVGSYFAFIVDEIVVEGNEKYSDKLIADLSGIVTGKHMLLVDTQKAAENIESTPYIKVIDVKRVFPRTISVTVKERNEAAIILGQAYDVIIDVEGHVLTIGASTNPDGLLRVMGMSAHGYQVNKSIAAGGDVQAATLRAIMEQLSSLDMMNDVEELNMSNPLRVTLKSTDGIDALLGQADNLLEKLSWMKDSLISLRASNIHTGILDLGAKGGPVFSPSGVRVITAIANQDLLGDEDEPDEPDIEDDEPGVIDGDNESMD